MSGSVKKIKTKDMDKCHWILSIRKLQVTVIKDNNY